MSDEQCEVCGFSHGHHYDCENLAGKSELAAPAGSAGPQADSKARRTVELEYWIGKTVRVHGMEEGLSVHQIIGVLRVVESELLDKWKASKKIPQNDK